MYNDAGTIKVGLRIVMVGLIVLMVLGVLELLAELLTKGGLMPILRFALLTWICWSVYGGKVWARLVLAAMLVISGVMSLLAASVGGSVGVFVGLVGVLDLMGAVGLFVIPQVNAYLEYVAAQTQ